MNTTLKKLIAAPLFLLAACGTPAESNGDCGDADSFVANGNTYCVATRAIIEKGFSCPLDMFGLEFGDVTTRRVVRDGDISGERPQSSGPVTTPVSVSAFDRPPSVFGPMDVDTSDETRPKIVDGDFADAIRVQQGPGGLPSNYQSGGTQGRPAQGGFSPQYGAPRGAMGQPPLGGPPSSGHPQGLPTTSQRSQSPAQHSTQHLPEYREPEAERNLVTTALIFTFVALAAFGCTAIGWIVFHKMF